MDRILYPGGGIEEAHFDETGSVSGTTDALGRSTRLINDAQGKPTSIIDAAGQLTRISYNDMSLPLQIIDPPVSD